jgi:hypothetical protein
MSFTFTAHRADTIGIKMMLDFDRMYRFNCKAGEYDLGGTHKGERSLLFPLTRDSAVLLSMFKQAQNTEKHRILADDNAPFPHYPL